MPHSHLNRICRTIDTMSEWTGRAIAWLVLLMVLIIVYDISMRYFFQIGSVALQELEWHLFAMLFLIGAAYTLKHDGHVRVDILYQSHWMGARGRAIVDIFGTVFLLFPFCILIIVSSGAFVGNSFSIAEGSPDPGGLPYRFVLKAMIPAAFILLILQGISQLVQAILQLTGANGSCTPSGDTSNTTKES